MKPTKHNIDNMTNRGPDINSMNNAAQVKHSMDNTKPIKHMNMRNHGLLTVMFPAEGS